MTEAINRNETFAFQRGKYPVPRADGNHVNEMFKALLVDRSPYSMREAAEEGHQKREYQRALTITAQRRNQKA
jgi:hypothetical protein